MSLSSVLKSSLILLCLVVFVSGYVIRKRDSQLTCSYTMPCAWEVYEAFSKETQYFVYNVCSCSRGKMCVRDGEDVSVTAYVYRCRSTPQSPK